MNKQQSSQMNPSKLSENIFDNLPSIQAPRPSDLRDELERFVSTDPEHVDDVFIWWYERKHIYPHLHRMALDYLTIPGMLMSIPVLFYPLINHCQPHQSTLNEPLAKDDLSSLMCGVGSLSSRHEHSCVLGFGVQWVM